MRERRLERSIVFDDHAPVAGGPQERETPSHAARQRRAPSRHRTVMLADFAVVLVIATAPVAFLTFLAWRGWSAPHWPNDPS